MRGGARQVIQSDFTVSVASLSIAQTCGRFTIVGVGPLRRTRPANTLRHVRAIMTAQMRTMPAQSLVACRSFICAVQ